MKKAVKVFKFGGASVKDAAGVKNVASIVERYKSENLAIVVSAMGKVTNAMEGVVNAHFNGTGEAAELYEAIKHQHYAIMADLFELNHPVFATVNDVFVEVEWILEDPVDTDYDYVYDQMIGIGELVSSCILCAYLNQVGIETEWLDARGLLVTDNTYREGRIQWVPTQENVDKQITPVLNQGRKILTQGFIAATDDNQTVTLGREGSDYSAAILSYCLDAESMTIWKDVPGVLTADPRMFENVTKLDRLSYKEAIEMTYYGASVIHPKTIKPLQNKTIPLHVKSFLKPEDDGTFITNDVDANYPPIVIVEKNQVLLYISSNDFSFIAEHHLSALFTLFDKYRVWVNMMRNTAISFMVCVPNQPDRLKGLFKDMENDFSVMKEEGVELITIRHYTEEMLTEMKKGKIILLEEKIRKTFQIVAKNVPIMKRIID
jgi:aspartate kinase